VSSLDDNVYAVLAASLRRGTYYQYPIRYQVVGYNPLTKRFVVKEDPGYHIERFYEEQRKREQSEWSKTKQAEVYKTIAKPIGGDNDMDNG
jgi:hypothetical protein